MTGICTSPSQRDANDSGWRKRSRLVLGLGATPLARALESYFREQGWDVVHAKSNDELRQLSMRSTAIVMTTESLPETGLLTCAKVTTTRRRPRVVLLGPENVRMARFARFAGAVGYLPEGCGAAAVVRAVLGT